jgi:hypothetical protein
VVDIATTVWLKSTAKTLRTTRLTLATNRPFAEWVNYSLDKQRSDLEAYLDGIEKPRADVLKSWAAIMPYKSLVPAGAGDAERYLYVSDLEIILELLRNELAASS